MRNVVSNHKSYHVICIKTCTSSTQVKLYAYTRHTNTIISKHSHTNISFDCSLLNEENELFPTACDLPVNGIGPHGACIYNGSIRYTSMYVPPVSPVVYKYVWFSWRSLCLYRYIGDRDMCVGWIKCSSLYAIWCSSFFKLSRGWKFKNILCLQFAMGNHITLDF